MTGLVFPTYTLKNFNSEIAVGNISKREWHAFIQKGQ